MRKLAKRLKNPAVVTALVSGILIALVNTSLIDVELSTKVTEIMSAILTVGVAFGILSNPDETEK
jgi:uncharacterized membrane protein